MLEKTLTISNLQLERINYSLCFGSQNDKICRVLHRAIHSKIQITEHSYKKVPKTSITVRLPSHLVFSIGLVNSSKIANLIELGLSLMEPERASCVIDFEGVNNIKLEKDSMELEGLRNDRELVVIALQSLHRERVNAYNSAWTFADINKKPYPKEEDFGINESIDALKRIGAMPSN